MGAVLLPEVQISALVEHGPLLGLSSCFCRTAWPQGAGCALSTWKAGAGCFPPPAQVDFSPTLED